MFLLNETISNIHIPYSTAKLSLQKNTCTNFTVQLGTYRPYISLRTLLIREIPLNLFIKRFSVSTSVSQRRLLFAEKHALAWREWQRVKLAESRLTSITHFKNIPKELGELLFRWMCLYLLLSYTTWYPLRILDGNFTTYRWGFLECLIMKKPSLGS